jgi:endo-beta-N-acetylglucosaminidase D
MTRLDASRRQFMTLAGATAAMLTLPAAMARAADTGSIAPAYPLTGGDSWDVFKAYDPATNPSAPFFRSHVRRAKRIPPFAATQAHPAQNAEVPGGTLLAAYLTLAGPDEDLNRTRYQTGARSRVHVERSWQYQDIVVAWNTTGYVPNAALIDAAHRNGARILATMFQPDKRIFDGSDLPRTEVAKKLVYLAAYFGFDGYFVNFESYTDDDARAVQDLIGLMQVEAIKQGLSDFHIQYYNGYTDAAAVWPGSPHVDGSPREADAPRANSMMLDQGWSNYGLTRGCCSGHPIPDVSTLALPQYDPKNVYYGLQLYPGPGYLGLMAPVVVTPNGGPASGGLQVYSAEDGLRKMRRARLDQLKASTSLSAQDREDLADLTDPKRTRKAWYRLHRQFWSGQSGNPARNNTPTAAEAAIYGPADVRKIYTDYEAPGKPTDQLNLPITYGVANFITERSIVGALPFVTHFNTGEGDRFFLDGVKVAETPWFNLGIQDVLPTWAWWTKPLDRPLDADKGADGLLDVDYDFDDAYDGGASLAITGRLGPENATEVHLYKTQVSVDAKTTLGLVLKGGTGGVMKAGLVFEDAPDVTEWIDIKAGKALALGWKQWTQGLAKYEGRTLAVVSLGFASTGKAKAYRINIGELSLTDGAEVSPAQLEGFRIAQSRIQSDGQSAELQLDWTFDPAVPHYDLVTVTGKTKNWLGRITGNAYYISALARDKGATHTILHLVPSNGKPAAVTFNWT